jgi:hypothetical protein
VETREDRGRRQRAKGGSVLGIDVGERALHCVELATVRKLGRAELIDPDETSDLVEWSREGGKRPVVRGMMFKNAARSFKSTRKCPMPC